MKKLGFLPIKDRAFRYPKADALCKSYTDGVTDIGIFTAVLLTALLLAFHAKFADGKCGGVDRWSVKTLQDGFIPRAPEHESISDLIQLKLGVRWTRTLPRQPLEKTTVTLKCNLIGVGVEADSDFHLVLSDGKHTMIGEIPKGECAASKYSKLFDSERAAVEKAIGYYPHSIKMLKKPLSVQVTGVIFFDEPNHNGKGHAKNEIEIHPLTKFQLQ